MVDCYPKETRSRVMSHIRSADTNPEITVRKELWRLGFRGYRVNAKLPGKPDIVFTKSKVAVFIDGCFWHKCPLCYIEPKTNKEYWLPKIERNVQRDQKVNQILTDAGWQVVRIWEHEIKKNPDEAVQRILDALKHQ